VTEEFPFLVTKLSPYYDDDLINRKWCEMNKLNMPGFAAGASLYPAAGQYRTLSVAPAPCDAVAPQMTKVEAEEFMRSLLAGPGGVAPPWGGGGGGGGSGAGTVNTAYELCKTSCDNEKRTQMQTAKKGATAAQRKSARQCEHPLSDMHGGLLAGVR